jgi:calcium-binding protein CML
LTVKDGFISEKELVEVSLTKIENCTEEDQKLIRDVCDVDGDGKIDFMEFLEMMAQFQYNKRRTACGMNNLFKAFDVDKDGFLSKDELKRAWMMFMNAKEEVAEKNVTQLMAKHDKDGDGKINFDEFVGGLFNISHGKRRGRMSRNAVPEGEDAKAKKKTKRKSKNSLKNAKKESTDGEAEKKEEKTEEKKEEAS